VRHVSGICSYSDWVSAAADAGYKFTSSQVAYCVSSLPEKQRPVEYKNCQSAVECHDTFPKELIDRLHPWRMESGSNWLKNNPSGKLVIIPSSAGLICMHEEEINSKAKCEFKEDDINSYVKELEKAISYTDKNEVNTYYNMISLGEKLDMGLLEKWLQAIQPYVDSGKVQWKTLSEMYDAYIEWENKN